MRKANVFVNGTLAGELEEQAKGSSYTFHYVNEYDGTPVSLTMPLEKREIKYDIFPPFFEGLLPEGVMLDGLLRQQKIDKDDLFGQLVTVGKDLVGAVTVEEVQ